MPLIKLKSHSWQNPKPEMGGNCSNVRNHVYQEPVVNMTLTYEMQTTVTQMRTNGVPVTSIIHSGSSHGRRITE